MAEVQVPGVPPSVAAGVPKSSPDSSGAVPNSDGSARSRLQRRSGTIYISLVLVATTIAAYFLLHQAPSAVSSHSEGEAALDLDTFIVNLEGGDQRAYLRVGITLGLSQPLTRKEGVPVASLRDTIVSTLSSTQPEQLLTPKGKQEIKRDLLKALQERAPGLGIENVYFTEFLVQM